MCAVIKMFARKFLAAEEGAGRRKEGANLGHPSSLPPKPRGCCGGRRQGGKALHPQKKGSNAVPAAAGAALAPRLLFYNPGQ